MQAQKAQSTIVADGTAIPDETADPAYTNGEYRELIQKAVLEFNLGHWTAPFHSNPRPPSSSPIQSQAEPFDVGHTTPELTPLDTTLWTPLTSQKLVGIGLAAAGIVAVGLGATFSVLALNDKASSKHRCLDNLCDVRGLSDRQSALAHADVATPP